MSDLFKNKDDRISKHDIDVIMEVNKRSIQVQTEVMAQNEDIADELSDIKKSQICQDKKIDKLVKNSEDFSKELFQMKTLLLTSFVNIILQVISFLIKK